MGLEGIAAIQSRIQEIQGINSRAIPPAPVEARTPPAATNNFASLLDTATAAGGATLGTAKGSDTAQRFLAVAKTQQGKPYVWGASAAATDADPKAFDCSEFTKWAAARVGVALPEVASTQYIYLRDQGATIPVDQALRTPGALLFHFPHEPRDANDDPSAGHVAISVGDGVHTIEAKGRAYGTGVFEAGNRFQYAGIIPGM
jgi:cell wall-associated NlpC family hydrolase